MKDTKTLRKKVIIKKHKSSTLDLKFSFFAKWASGVIGNGITFVIALLAILILAILGKYYNYSQPWQLIISTGATIIIFLVVFLIQNTQNRNMDILQLKLDELIKSKKGASNNIINLHELSDAELKILEKEYQKLKGKTTGI